MKILVNGKQAELKAGSSFEYVSENPLFTEAEDYSMDIEFPMKDCPQNIAIFGALHVKGVDISTVSFPCEIITESFDKTGILTITGVSNSEVKGQFLKGMSQQNYSDSLPDTLICDLDFSYWDGTEEGSGHAASVARLMGSGWTNMVTWNEEAERPYRNAMHPDDSYGTIWVRNIYLYHLVELVGAASGWTINDSALRLIPMYMSIVVANKRNYLNNNKYRKLGLFLPRWTVKEFIKQVSHFFGCVYKIDSVSHKITFIPCSQLMTSSSIKSLSVNDDFEIEVGDEDSSYRGNKGFSLAKECNEGNLNICSWINEDIVSLRYFKRYATPYTNISDLNTKIQNSISGDGSGLEWPSRLAKVTSIDKYVAEIEYKEFYEGNTLHHYAKLEILNQYGGPTDGDELGIVPCNFIVADAERDYYIEDNVYKMPKYKLPLDPEFEDQFTSYNEIISEGEQGIDKFYFDKLWVVIKSGTGTKGFNLYTKRYEAVGAVTTVSGEDFEYTSSFVDKTYTLSPYADAKIIEYNVIPKVDETQLYRYKFLGTTIPSPTSVFLINGQKFACLRITAHFTVDGMSELLEGEFYRIID